MHLLVAIMAERDETFGCLVLKISNAIFTLPPGRLVTDKAQSCKQKYHIHQIAQQILYLQQENLVRPYSGNSDTSKFSANN